MSIPRVECVTSRAIVGEGPHWDQAEQVLYTVDVWRSEVRKYDPATKKENIVKIEGGLVTFVVPVQGHKGKFVIDIERDFAILTWDGVSSKPSQVERIATVDDVDGKRENRLNDGKADPTGRLWAGTMGPLNGPLSSVPNTASLFSLSKERKTTTHLNNISLSNGLAWSPDSNVMYYIDSLTRKVDAFDFDAQMGQISNRRAIFDFEANNVKGYPDGMTIDVEGKLWVACYEGSQVIRIDPETGKLLKAIPVPALKVTSVAFGGAQLDELYVTTASVGLSEEDKKATPSAGCTFRVTGTGTKGFSGQSVVL